MRSVLSTVGSMLKKSRVWSLKLVSFLVGLRPHRRPLLCTKFSSCFGFIIIRVGDGYLEILITLVFFSMFIYSIASSNFNQSAVMPCRHFSSFAGGTRPYAYFTDCLTCSPILKSLNPSDLPWHGTCCIN